jgi:hypothetical protein
MWKSERYSNILYRRLAYRSGIESEPPNRRATQEEIEEISCATPVIPPFPYEHFEAWLVTTLESGNKLLSDSIIEKGSSFVCIQISESQLYWPFQETASVANNWSTTFNWFPYFYKEPWTPFTDSRILKWELIGRDGNALEKAVVMAQGFKGRLHQENGYQKCFLLYSRADEYEHEDNTTVASVIHDVASLGERGVPHAPAMVNMLIAYPQKIPDVLVHVKEWSDVMVDAFVVALTTMPIDCELKGILLAETMAETFPRHRESLSVTVEKMHRAFLDNASSTHGSRFGVNTVGIS